MVRAEVIPPEEVFDRSPIDIAWRSRECVAWFEEPPRDRSYLLHSDCGAGVLPMSQAACLSAAGGVGKTNIVLQLAVSVATRRPWLGHYLVPEGAPRRSLLLLGEEDEDEIHRRIFAIAQGLGLTDSERKRVTDNIVALPLAGQLCPLMQVDERGVPVKTIHVDALRALLQHDARDGWGLVVIDPQARFCGLEVETSNATATQFVQLCESFTQAPGAPVVLVCAHTSKLARRSGSADNRGVTALTDGFRWHATLADDGARVRLKVQKNNYGPPSDELCLVRVSGAGGMLRAETGEEREGRERATREAAIQKEHAREKARADRTKKNVEKVNRVASAQPGLSKTALAAAAGGKKAHILEAIDVAVADGRLRYTTTGTRHSYFAVSGSQ